MRRLRSALVGLADSVTEAERKAVVQRYLHHLNLVVEHSMLDAEDQVMALQEDRQGLGHVAPAGRARAGRRDRALINSGPRIYCLSLL